MSERKDRLSSDIPLSVGLMGLIACAIAGYVKNDWAIVLPAIAVFAWAPLAFGAVLLPRLHLKGVTPASLEVPMGGFVTLGILAMLPVYALVSGDVGPSRAHATRIGSIVIASLAAIPVIWLWFASRARLAMVRRLVTAPPHPKPMRDDVWGASDGKFPGEVFAVGEDVEAHSNDSVSTKRFRNIAYEATLTRDGGDTVVVRLAEADLLTTVHFDDSTGNGKAKRGDKIDGTCTVRVAGRAQGGVLIRHDGSPVLVFAAARGNVRRQLARLYVRLMIAPALALGGVACLVAALFV